MAEKKQKKPAARKPAAGKKKTIVKDNFVSVKIKRHRDKNGGHHHIILENFENNHVSVGLTTKAKKGKNSPNYKCETDPLGTGKTSYLRRKGTVAPIKEYDKHEKKGKLTPKDYAKAQEYGSKAKEKYLRERKK